MTTQTEITQAQLLEEVAEYAVCTTVFFEDDEETVKYWRENFDRFPNTREKTTIGWYLEGIDGHDGPYGCGKDCFVCYSVNEWVGIAEAREDVRIAEKSLAEAEAELVRWGGLSDLQNKVVQEREKVIKAKYDYNWLTTRF